MTGVGFDVQSIDDWSAKGRGVEEPDEGGKLEHVVERDEVEDEAGELVDHVEDTEYYPVSEPLGIVTQAIRLESVEAHEHRVCNTEESGDDWLADAKHDEGN